MRRLILFLLRKKLHLRKGERFQFTNQKNDNEYYFTARELIKVVKCDKCTRHDKSLVSLNHLISDECKIRRV